MMSNSDTLNLFYIRTPPVFPPSNRAKLRVIYQPCRRWFDLSNAMLWALCNLKPSLDSDHERDGIFEPGLDQIGFSERAESKMSIV